MKLSPERLADIPYCDGPLDAKIAFVAEAPGQSEEAHEQNSLSSAGQGRCFAPGVKASTSPRTPYI